MPVLLSALLLVGCSHKDYVQWGLDNTGQYVNGKKGVCGVDVDFHDKSGLLLSYPEKNPVAVVDTPINFAHKYLGREKCIGLCSIRKSSMLFVCAVGNENKEQMDYSAAYDLPNVISVVGINNYGYCSSYSNYSKNADIAAPGEDVLCIGEKDGLQYMSGSSFAVPFITATCIYIIDQTNCTPLEAKNILLETARHLDSLEGKVNSGRLVSFENIKKY